jgi:hypothetical protein
VRLIRALAICLALSGCAALAPERGGDKLPPLPAVAALHCCWLSEEQVTLNGEQGEQVLHTVVEVSRNQLTVQLTVVVLDATGRRLLALRYDDRDGLRELTAPPSWDSNHSRYLAMAIFLHHAEPGRWLQQASEWQVQRQGAVKSLTRNGRQMIALEYREPGNLDSQPRVLRVPGSDLAMAVITLSRTAL